VLPLALVCWSRLPRSGTKIWVPLLMFAWSVGEWGSNVMRGVAVALGGDTTAGKGAVAARVEQLLGPDFPYYVAHVACVALVVAWGMAFNVPFAHAGMKEAAARRGESSIHALPEQMGSAVETARSSRTRRATGAQANRFVRCLWRSRRRAP